MMASMHVCLGSQVAGRPLAKTAFNARRAQPARQCRVAPVQAGLFGGGGGDNPMANLAKMGSFMEDMKKAQAKVQSEAARIQTELGAAEFAGYSVDETVQVIMSGNQEPKSVDITEAALEGGTEEINTRVLEAMKDAHSKSVAGMKLRMKDLASSLGLPNM